MFLSILVFSGCIIKGKVVDENGRGLAGVTVTLSGEASMTTTTDRRGFYQFGTMDSTLSEGSYSVTPSKPGYSFTPTVRNVTITTGTLEGYGEVPWPVGHVVFTDVRNENIIETSYGIIVGFDDEADTRCWKGIPFAKPPEGELRWKAPMDPDPWEGVRDATEFCFECIQYDPLTLGSTIIGSPDCLYLNVWRPKSDETDLPVYVWLHGGANSIGSGISETYWGANLASKSNVVYVSINYRLGPLGWFTHPALRTGDYEDDSGNYGTLDIIQALKWIQSNIEAFGGDPDNVTVAGESAGAFNAFSLMLSPIATGLFHKVIAESGGPSGTPIAVGEASAEDVLLKLLVNDGTVADESAAAIYVTNMSDAEIASYLRSKSFSEIAECYGAGGTGFGTINFPNVFTDGRVILAEGSAAFETGTYPNKVPVVMGSNKDELKLMLAFNPDYAQVDDETYHIITSYNSDLWKAVGVDGLARKMISYPDQPDVFVYQFLWGSLNDNGESVMPTRSAIRLGACHSSEIDFFLGNDFTFHRGIGDMAGFPMVTEQNRPGREALQDAIMSYMAQFVRTGDPGTGKAGSTLPEWTPWSNNEGEPKYILLDAGYDAISIEMSEEELTEEEVRAEINALPAWLSEAVKRASLF